MAEAHKLDCEAAEADCRFIIQSENEEEALELAKNHMEEVHGKELTDDFQLVIPQLRMNNPAPCDESNAVFSMPFLPDTE